MALASSESMREPVTRDGLDFFAVGMDWHESSAERSFPELVGMPLEEQGLWWVTDIFGDRAARPAAEDLVQLIGSWTADLVVRDTWDFGAWAAAEATGVPQAVLGLAMFDPTADVEDFLGTKLRRLRAHLGGDPEASLGTLYAGPYVDLLPASWQYHLPPNRIPMRPVAVPANPRSDGEWLGPLPHPATVLVTFGTVFNHTKGVFETVVEALADKPVNVLLTTGADRDPAGLGPLPANVRAERFVPHAQVLPSCDAVVCHAGFGTTMAALAHGLPIVAIPLSADQPVHAARSAELGVGRVLPPEGLTAPAVSAAVAEVLQDSRTRTNAALLADEIRSMSDTDVAADELLAAARR